MLRLFASLIIPLLGLGAGYAYRVEIRDALEDTMRKRQVPQSVTLSEVGSRKSEVGARQPLKVAPAPHPSPLLSEPEAPSRWPPGEGSLTLPREFNLAIPFTSQAPHGNWDAPYKESCEEASALMAHWFFAGRKKVSADEADAEIKKLVQWEISRFDYYEDTNAEETAVALEEYFGRTTRLIENPTVEDIKKELAAGHPVIVPAAGRKLGNPYFRQPGPLYHMLVLKGYTKDGKFVTNDPGTRRGADYLYPFARIMDAMRDWPGNENIESGRKVVIVVEG